MLVTFTYTAGPTSLQEFCLQLGCSFCCGCCICCCITYGDCCCCEPVVSNIYYADMNMATFNMLLRLGTCHAIYRLFPLITLPPLPPDSGDLILGFLPGYGCGRRSDLPCGDGMQTILWYTIVILVPSCMMCCVAEHVVVWTVVRISVLVMSWTTFIACLNVTLYASLLFCLSWACHCDGDSLVSGLPCLEFFIIYIYMYILRAISY